MGTNIYAKYKGGPNIHIGKFSSGWQFLLNGNDNKYYDYNNVDISIYLFDKTICDEYGLEITLREFWDKIEKHSGLKSSDKNSTQVGNLRVALSTEFS